MAVGGRPIARKRMDIVMKDNSVNEMFSPFCETLETAIGCEKNPAAKMTYQAMLMKMKTAKQNDKRIIDEFYEMAKDKETLKKNWQNHPYRQPQMSLASQAPQTSTVSDLVHMMSGEEERLEKEKDHLEKKCHDKQDTVNQLEIENRDRKKEIIGLGEQIRKLEKEQRELQDKIKILAKKLKESDKKNKNIYGKYKNEMKELEDTRTKLANITSELEDTKTKLANITTESEDTKTKLANFTSELEDTKTKLANITSELEDTKTKLANITTESEDTKTKLANITTESEDNKTMFTTALEDTNKRLAAVEARLKQRDDKSDIMLLGQVFVDFENQVYLAVHSNASTSYGHNYYVKDIETHTYENQEDREAARKSWEELKRDIQWDTNYENQMKKLRKSRNELAHPIVQESAQRQELLKRLKSNTKVTETDYEIYVRICSCYDKFEDWKSKAK